MNAHLLFHTASLVAYWLTLAAAGLELVIVYVRRATPERHRRRFPRDFRILAFLAVLTLVLMVGAAVMEALTR